jgi:hypothetical protein
MLRKQVVTGINMHLFAGSSLPLSDATVGRTDGAVQKYCFTGLERRNVEMGSDVRGERSDGGLPDRGVLRLTASCINASKIWPSFMHSSDPQCSKKLVEICEYGVTNLRATTQV